MPLEWYKSHTTDFLLVCGSGLALAASFPSLNLDVLAWGHVEGIDRDAESLDYARATYPELGFHICDVLDVPRTVARTFDVIYMLNAFYAFDRQREALAELRKVAKPAAQLVIFDYTVGPKSPGAPAPPLMPHAI